jgi:hydrogenase nickel incorporation protein HypB
MCTNCGCAVTPGTIEIHNHDHEHPHTHEHDHEHLPHDHSHQTLTVHEAILSKNERLAERNRGFFWGKGLFVLNVLSSPGSGKTAFIERTLTDINSHFPGAVIVGDLATDNDAQRLRRSGAQVVQITTGSVCHLEADMVAKALPQINLDQVKLLIIENVGNLVCPAAYDLGENKRIALLSVTEGEDKPLKYPTLFKTANVVIINKMDIAEAVGFDRELALTNIKKIVPQAQIFEVSAKTGQGMNQWYQFLEQQIQEISALLTVK